MPRKRRYYSEKYSKDDLRAAVGSVLKNRSSTYKPSKKYNVPFNNLKRFQYASSGPDDVVIPKKGRSIAVTVEEDQICVYVYVYVYVGVYVCAHFTCVIRIPHIADRWQDCDPFSTCTPLRRAAMYMMCICELCRVLGCAAQQLNASQSTHRFSFVNHTIKTVNMPKVRHSVNLKSKLTSYISEFKEDGLSTDNKILFCNLCQCAVSSTQKFLVQQHITTSKHQANKQLNSKQRQLFLTQPTTSNVRSEFNIDLCRSLISADIPLYKLKNKVFREFLEKYTQHTIPDESTLRKTYAPSIYDETIQKIRDEIKDSSIWVSIDETPDKEGRLVGNVVIGLLSEQYSERILLHCDVLEKCNNKTIRCCPYMVKAGQALSVVYPKLTHFTCVAHAFHRVAEVVRDNSKVDLLISSVKKYFKAPSRVNVLKEMYPEIPLPPKPILTRWGTWLEAVEYYAEHIDSINNVLLALDSEDAVSIDTAKTVTCDISVKNDLAHIQHTFSCIIKNAQKSPK
ncbi:hypothetical protein ANN_25117 [Periplaneta americana]|uniref:DUF659 domain-containing protein n=1 Tax=Periplaneta americana TaxID=6978 RepID=A0ABQ8S0G0_PERAM|nr:hypothetical protein ANN_25117 [Periplaneta americana]